MGSHGQAVVPTRVIAIYPNRLGYAYVVMESAVDILHWNMVKVQPADNRKILEQVKRVIKTYSPVAVIMEDCDSKVSRKTPRVRELISSISAWSKRNGYHVARYSREDIRGVFNRFDGVTTKYEIASIIARNVPALEPMLYDKPKYPYYEKFAVALFDSASLAIAHYFLSE